jgi:hypothetical protein
MTKKVRAKPGSTGKGGFFRIEVRPKGQFKSFRVQDVGGPGGLERVAGYRSSGSWATHAWLVSKEKAHRVGDSLIPDHEDVVRLLKTLGSKPTHVRGDIFKAKDRKNVAEKDKPTPAQKKAQAENIKKAQAARRKK